MGYVSLRDGCNDGLAGFFIEPEFHDGRDCFPVDLGDVPRLFASRFTSAAASSCLLALYAVALTLNGGALARFRRPRSAFRGLSFGFQFCARTGRFLALTRFALDARS
jgi:hypothetical protein